MSGKYTAHAATLLDFVQSLKSDGVLFDFIIKVEDESIHAHRMILAAYSEYFRAMFSHDTKELQEREVEMKDVRAHAMKECLEFMYTSEFSVDIDSVEDILILADMLQLSKVTESCMSYLSTNLNVCNCIYVLKLLETFPDAALQSKCIDFIKHSFSNVITSVDFKQLSLQDVKKYIADYKNDGDSMWYATVSWIEHYEDDRATEILEFVKLIMSHRFPSYSVLKRMWSKEWFTNSVDAQETVFKSLFSDISRLKCNLSGCNCSFLKLLADRYEHVTKEANNVILLALKQNLDQVMASDEFLQYSKDDVTVLFCSEDAEYLSPESAKWNAMIKWLKHNDGNDDIFPTLLKSIKFDLLSVDFINAVVRNEPLIKKYHSACKFLFHKIGNHTKMQKSFLVVLYEDYSLKEWDLATKLSRDLPRLSLPFCDLSTFGHNFFHLVNLNNNLCLLIGRKLFHLMKNRMWVEKARVGHTVALDAKVVACDGCLYIVEQEYLSKYNPEKDQWLENLCRCPLKPMHVTASEKHVYCSTSPESDIIRYNPHADHWTKFCSSPKIEYSGILFVNSILYALGCTNMALYDMRYKAWMQRKGHRQTDRNSLHFLDANGDIVAFRLKANQDSILTIYGASYDHWMNIELVIPQRSGLFGTSNSAACNLGISTQTAMKTTASVCSFSKRRPINNSILSFGGGARDGTKPKKTPGFGTNPNLRFVPSLGGTPNKLGKIKKKPEAKSVKQQHVGQ